MKSFSFRAYSMLGTLSLAALLQCSSDETTPDQTGGSSSGGTSPTGGASVGGATTGGSAGAPAGSNAGGSAETSAGIGGTSGAGTGGTGAGSGGVSGAGLGGFSGAGAGGSVSGGAGAGGSVSGGAGAGGSVNGGAGAGGNSGTGAGAGIGGAGSGGGGTGGKGGAGAGGAAGKGGAGGAGAGGKGGSGGGINFNSFMIGADLSWVQEDEAGGARYLDNGTQKDVFQLFKDHGFNWIRLRTFVNPTATGGYSTQGYCDIAHTATVGRRIKQAGLGFIINFHYSDYWADPGKQIKPLAWRNITTIQALATQVHDYTRASIQTLVDGGARPEVAQIGNETTPGMIMHVPNNPSNPDGPLTTTTPNGSIANWDNLAMLYLAAINAVHEVDPTIEIMLHLDRGGDFASSRNFIQNAQQRNVPFDYFGLSCYQVYQGGPTACGNVLNQLVTAFPSAAFKFILAEYAVDATNSTTIMSTIRGTNDVVRNLPNSRGFGTLIWEPTHGGAWGEGLFTWSGNNNNAIAARFSMYDQMRAVYGP
jgi:arabinogalactan endo-1,4-beta-galactosidase